MSEISTINFINDDWKIDDLGNLEIVTGLEALRVNMYQFLSLRLGSWVDDVDLGIPYDNNLTPQQFTVATTKIILEHFKDYVTIVNDATVEFDEDNREFHYNFSFTSIYGEVVLNG